MQKLNRLAGQDLAMTSSGQVAKTLNVSTETIRQWVDKPEFAAFFTSDARGINKRNRQFSHSDVLVLNTINHLRQTEPDFNWREIAAKLEEGFRHDQYPSSDIGMSSMRIPYEQAEQSAKASATMAERDAALARVSEMQQEIEKLQEGYRGEIDKLKEEHRHEVEYYRRQMKDLNEQVAQLNREIGRLEGQLTRDSDDED